MENITLHRNVAEASWFPSNSWQVSKDDVLDAPPMYKMVMACSFRVPTKWREKNINNHNHLASRRFFVSPLSSQMLWTTNLLEIYSLQSSGLEHCTDARSSGKEFQNQARQYHQKRDDRSHDGKSQANCRSILHVLALSERSPTQTLKTFKVIQSKVVETYNLKLAVCHLMMPTMFFNAKRRTCIEGSKLPSDSRVRTEGSQCMGSPKREMGRQWLSFAGLRELPKVGLGVEFRNKS